MVHWLLPLSLMELTFTLVPHKAISTLSTPIQENRCGRRRWAHRWDNQRSPVWQPVSKSLLFQRENSSRCMDEGVSNGARSENCHPRVTRKRQCQGLPFSRYPGMAEKSLDISRMS